MPLELICDLCGKKFNRHYNLKRHFSTIHPGKKCNLPLKKYVALKCGICREDLSHFEKFKDHVLENHSITLQFEKHEFKNETDFICWKKTIEEKDNGLFVKNTGKNGLANNASVIIFQCHRSGYFMSKVLNNRKREIKIQGTSKINAYCPCRMKTTIHNDGKVVVDFCVTHVGHKNELEYVNIPFSERKVIAEKIASKIPYDVILDEVRSTANINDLKRKHFITRHDLYNIEKEFKLKTDRIRLQQQKFFPVDEWIVTEKQSENSCILVHKPQDVFASQFPNLNKDDFLLVIMTNAQIEVLKRIGTFFICIESTHGGKKSNFDLVSLFVLDDLKQGFPCAFFISNRIDDDGLEIFFSAIKNKIGVIHAKCFLSDTNSLFYRVWQNVMSSVDAHLFCTWHVDQDWNKHLSLIKNPFKRRNIYNLLKTLLEEPDENTFQAMLAVISQQLSDDEETKSFGLYFQSKYLHCSQSWACSFRKKLGIDYHINLEQIHQTIRYLYLKGKRLDKAIQTIMHMLKNRFFDYLTVLEKGERIAKLKDLRIRHNKSLYMPTELVSKNQDDSWKIASSSKLTLQYVVRLVKPDCDCNIVCKQCITCIHKYNCTCIDASVKWNMCKHIHLLCRTLAGHKLENTTVISDTVLNKSCDNIPVYPKNENSEDLCIIEETIKEEAKDVEFLDLNEIEAQEVDIVQIEGQDCSNEIIYLELESSTEQIQLLRQVSFNNFIESPSFLELKYDLVKKFSSILNNINTIEEINFIKDQINNLPSHLGSFQNNQFISTAK